MSYTEESERDCVFYVQFDDQFFIWFQFALSFDKSKRFDLLQARARIFVLSNSRQKY